MALLKQFGTEDEEILKRMRSQSAPISRPEPVFVNPQQAPVPAQPQSGFRGILGNIASGLQDREKLMQLGMVLSSMNPNSQNLTNVLQYNLDTMKEDRELKSQANKTAEFFRAQGRDDLAMAIEQNPQLALELTKAFYASQFKSPSAFSEKVDALSAFMPKDEAVKMAASTGGTTVNMPSVGSIPAGYQAIYDDAGRVVRMEPIAGGPVEQKMSEGQKAMDEAFKVYEVGIANLGEALGQTETGYLYGKIPAITSGAQTFEAAGDLMLPVLKDIFRKAGEGTFTDSDQRVMENMLPTRGDAPEAARAKMRMLDDMIRAKLGKPLAPKIQQDQQKTPRLRFNPETNQLEEVGG